MAQLVLARQPLRERYLPADQIEIDIKKGQLGCDLAAENTLGERQKSPAPTAPPKTAKIQQPRVKKQPSVKK
jgi:hypothetical protein